MAGKLAPMALLPFASGCITVQHRHYLIDFDRLAGPLTDSGLTGWLLVVASCSGLLGGAAAWIVARRGRRSPET